MADDLIAQMLEVFDEDHAGFGTTPKFPHCQVLELFVARWRAAPDGRLRDVVTRTLDAIGWGGLHDEVEGGFFRYTRGRDWTAPQLEKVLETNARLLRVYLEAGIAFDERRYIDRTAGVVGFVQSRLAEGPEGGFFIGRKTDPQYYDLASPAERRARPSPPCDTALYTDANAEMAGAYLALGAWLRDASLFDFGLQTLERVILATYRPGLGLAHACGGHTGVRGLLVDHVRAVDALLEAHRGTENLVYVEMAEELMHYCHRVMWDEAVGGFFDRASERDEPELGLLAEPLKPLVLNCDAARTLFRLATVSGDSRFADRARAALASQASAMRGAGLLGAAYGLAVAAAGGRA